MTAVAIVADDLTGGCDTGTLFGAHGPVPLAIWPRPFPAGSVGVIDTESRALPPADAAGRVRAAVAHAGPARVFKKIDSTLRGRIGAETEALMDARGLSTALLCPAFPAQKRAVVDRMLTVDGVPVGETPVARDPEFPAPAGADGGRVRDVAELLRPQFGRALGWIPLDEVRAGAGALGRCLARLAGTVILADAETDADLDALAAASGALESTPLLVGSAGLAAALARNLGLHGGPVALPLAHRCLIVAGSQHPATRRQVEAARAAGLRVVAAPDTAGAAERPSDRAPAAAELASHRARVAADLAVDARRALEREAADLVFVTGGETAAALLAALGASRIDLVGAPGPGLALGYVDRPGRPPLAIVTKAGGFGADDLLVSLAAAAAQRPDLSRSKEAS